MEDNTPAEENEQKPVDKAAKRRRGRAPGPYSNDPNVSLSLKKLRVSRGLRQKDVVDAAEGEVSLNAYNQYEKGSMYPSESKLGIILDALGAPKEEWNQTYQSMSLNATPDVTTSNRVTRSPFPEALRELNDIYQNLTPAQRTTWMGLGRNYVKQNNPPEPDPQ